MYSHLFPERVKIDVGMQLICFQLCETLEDHKRGSQEGKW